MEGGWVSTKKAHLLSWFSGFLVGRGKPFLSEYKVWTIPFVSHGHWRSGPQMANHFAKVQRSSIKVSSFPPPPKMGSGDLAPRCLDFCFFVSP